MSREDLFERQVEHGAELRCTEQRARAFDQRIDVQVLVACRRVGRQVAEYFRGCAMQAALLGVEQLRAIGRMYSPR